MDVIGIVMLLIGMLIGGVFWALARTLIFKEKHEKARRDLEHSQEKVDAIVKEAEIRKQEILLEGRKENEKAKSGILYEFKERERRMNKREEQLGSREEVILQKDKSFDARDKKSKEFEGYLETQETRIKVEGENIKVELEKVAGMSQEEARDVLIQKVEESATHHAAKKLKAIEESYAEDVERVSKKMLSTAIQRYAGEYVVENTVTAIALPTDEMKGRIIGREGRNIRAIEAATGVDLIIDDTPETVVISDFNPIRRAVASQTLQKLISDGRIHPGRIEEVFNIATKEIWKSIKEAGDQALFDLGIHKMHPELILLIGRLRYRTSYGQNVWKHSIEAGFVGGLMATELGISVKNARRAGVLHDIGKAVDHEVEGGHANIGAKLAEKYGETKRIVHAIDSHHNDPKPETVLDVIIQAADALSGARPGARREMTESYIQRLKDLEDLATSFDGVEKAFAIQAGRELRVIVNTTKIKDDKTQILAHEISKKIEEELSYPGQIKIVLIRETRVVSMAQ